MMAILVRILQQILALFIHEFSKPDLVASCTVVKQHIMPVCRTSLLRGAVGDSDLVGVKILVSPESMVARGLCHRAVYSVLRLVGWQRVSVVYWPREPTYIP